MIKNRAIALIYRFVAAGIILAGIIIGSGFNPWPQTLLFYTTQSNILSLCFLVYLLIRTAFDLFKKGADGCACYSPRIAMTCVMFITFTFIIFWGMLAPFADSRKLWTFGNIAVHGLCPLLMVFDHLLFCEQGHLKKKDVFLCALLPLSYVLITSALGFLGVIFYYAKGVPYYFPYLFMDFNELGWFALICIAVIALIYILFAWLFVFIDGKWKKPIVYPKNKSDKT